MSLPQLLNTTAGRVTVGAEAVSLAAMAPFLLVEWSTFTAYSSERGGGVLGDAERRRCQGSRPARVSAGGGSGGRSRRRYALSSRGPGPRASAPLWL
jgi:hypothetical protein